MTRKNPLPYPRIHSLGLEIRQDMGISYIDRKELNEKLKLNNVQKEFTKFFGIQTCIPAGLFPSDVEAVLERIFSGKLTGTQHPLLWD